MIDEMKHAAMANAIRVLAMDAVEKAKSGHPGLPMGAADIATILFTKYLKFDPIDPLWPNRDRFILSAGHGSMLLYAILHLLGSDDMPMSELENFRQLESKTPGHPEHGWTHGVETTTGPLGQGLGNAVGMAIAERAMNAAFGDDLVNHKTYVLASDGDLMEGISHESISLAGHLRLSNLIVLFDDNGISIDGPIDLAESGDMIGRFDAAGWDTRRIDGHNSDEIEAALDWAQTNDRPTFIACKTQIGFGSPNKAGKAAAHGAPLGAEEIAATRQALGWSEAPFTIPSDILDAWRLAGLRSKQNRKEWEKHYADLDGEQKSVFDRRLRGDLPVGFDDAMAEYKRELVKDAPTIATRKASERVLEVINTQIPETIGGSADLTGSNNTRSTDQETFSAENYAGRFIHYGIREHGMASAMNGMALHGGVIPYSGTFLVFSDYCRPAIRLAALMKLRVIHVMTHDSIGLGEDGPTHQPIEHMASLRAMPGLVTFRPADATETAECWQLALKQKDRPSLLALTRQNLAPVRRQYAENNLCARGAYVVRDGAEDGADVTIFAAGSEVGIALAAADLLEEREVQARVVSVPSFELFDEQSPEYQAELIGNSPVRIAIEAGIRLGWDRFVGTDGLFIGLSDFGASGPYKEVYRHFGLTEEAVAEAAVARLEPLKDNV
ncbi:MAG: transketolase [Pseudomonadota bacterium]